MRNYSHHYIILHMCMVNARLAFELKHISSQFLLLLSHSVHEEAVSAPSSSLDLAAAAAPDATASKNKHSLFIYALTNHNQIIS